MTPNQPIAKPGGYEAHMTFDVVHAKTVGSWVDAGLVWNFVFSVITGCPLLGKGTYCYLTGYHREDPTHLKRAMDDIQAFAKSQGIDTLRSKIEHIVYDSKTGVNEL